jgi:hypothetical protein
MLASELAEASHEREESTQELGWVQSQVLANSQAGGLRGLSPEEVNTELQRRAAELEKFRELEKCCTALCQEKEAKYAACLQKFEAAALQLKEERSAYLVASRKLTAACDFLELTCSTHTRSHELEWTKWIANWTVWWQRGDITAAAPMFGHIADRSASQSAAQPEQTAAHFGKSSTQSERALQSDQSAKSYSGTIHNSGALRKVSKESVPVVPADSGQNHWHTSLLLRLLRGNNTVFAGIHNSASVKNLIDIGVQKVDWSTCVSGSELVLKGVIGTQDTTLGNIQYIEFGFPDSTSQVGIGVPCFSSPPIQVFTT